MGKGFHRRHGIWLVAFPKPLCILVLQTVLLSGALRQVGLYLPLCLFLPFLCKPDQTKHFQGMHKDLKVYPSLVRLNGSLQDGMIQVKAHGKVLYLPLQLQEYLSNG